MGLPNAPVDPRTMVEADQQDLSKQSELGDSESEELGDQLGARGNLPTRACKL